MARKDVLRELFEDCVQNTPKELLVVEKTVFLCGLTNTVANVLRANFRKVYASSLFLKHLYDKRPAEEFDFIIDNLHKVVKYPAFIYRNKPGKRGDWCFTKDLDGENYLCSLEISNDIRVATAFRIRDKSYLRGYDLLWSWRNDEPSS